ncbi:DUF4230 domain-containing protein [Myceligenerans pegani]|uniref:DUF4230 domain-containing protein n=1 Tax=Myceligenerans pegani TaxID=2776917 RepID=A0ABR9N5X9_9MICO|nr:DUF4230 domain-containing protein [Myceligenerans sp. TRM 65318]MBE1878513.1 DUF4230 domain-containing protein [Myceligenerans sp. TRM 65318]MBE3020784.1 DUF4230 domain-containing protein [Myceligenerans sp. TRM 65318]
MRIETDDADDDTADDTAATDPAGRPSSGTEHRARRRMPAWVAATLGGIAGFAIAAGIVGGVLAGLKDEFRDAFVRVLLENLNPFTTSQVDRSTEPVLLGMRDLARFVAAEAEYEVLVDLEQDVRYLPGWLAGSRLVLVVNGSVESYVDFSDLDPGAIEVSDDGTAVTVTVPEPELSDPRVDLGSSHALSEDRGLVDRIGDLFESNSDARQEALSQGSEKIAAAAEESSLTERARENTTKTLEALIESFGYETVTVEFEEREAS